MTSRTARACSLLTIILIASVGIFLSAQGWRSRVPTFDNILYIEGAHQLSAGDLPDRGILTSFGTYTPPGAAWLMWPGVAMFDDPRLYEIPGGALLFVGTLIGLFLLARLHFGRSCAVVAVIVYGLSPLAMSGSVSLWPRFPLPFFCVWMAYSVSQWALKRQNKYLAAALLFWSAGTFVFLEIAPAVFILPAVWLLWRPPVSVKPVLVAALVSIAMWLPYLRFQAERDFVDVKSQVKRQILTPVDYVKSWCNSSLVLRTLRVDDPPPAAAASRGRAVVTGNFEWNGQSKLAGGLLAALALFTAILCGVSGGRTSTAGRDPVWWWLGIASLAAAVLFNEVSAARYLSGDGVLASSTVWAVRFAEVGLLVAGMAMIAEGRSAALTRRSAAAAAAIAEWRWLPSSAFSAVLAELRRGGASLPVICLLVPWLLLSLTIEDASRVDRLWWLWPLQVVLLAALVTRVAALCRVPRVVRALAIVALIAVVADRRIPVKLGAWAADGWSGQDAPEMRVVDYLSRQLPRTGDASIGYQIYIWRFMAVFNTVDPHYKVGADFDVLFRDAHGVWNTDTCAEGVSPSDEYRIVQTHYDRGDTRAQAVIEVPADPRFRVIEHIGPYAVLKRFE